MTIYRSHEGKCVLEACYDEDKNQLGVELKERQIETRHGVTNVLLTGPADGQPVFLFHCGNDTNPITPAWYTDLADSNRLIAPDIIGHPGYSTQKRLDHTSDGSVEWVVDLLDAFEIESIPMIGTSYGSGIVLRTVPSCLNESTAPALIVPAGFGTGSLVILMRVSLPGLVYRIYPRDRLLEYVLSMLVTQPDTGPVVRATIAASLRHLKLVRCLL